MLNPFPLVNIFRLIKAPLISSLDSDSWRLKGYQKPLWHCNGAEILSKICQHNRKNLDAKISIMLPSYFCGQSLRFLRHINIDFIFYRLKEDLTPDYKNILNLLKDNKPNFFLHVHYF